MDPLSTLSDQITQLPLLSDAEVRRLSVRIKAGDNAARNHLVEHNIKLVWSIAKKYPPTMPLEDLIQEGTIGLIRAAELFDPEMGNRFSTYATIWIKQAITRSLMDKSRTVRIPTHVAERVGKINRAERAIEARNGGVDPTVSELAIETSLTEDEVVTTRSAEKATSSLEATTLGGEGTVADVIADENALEPFETMIDTPMQDTIHQTMEETLTDGEIKAVEYRVGLDLSLEAAGELMGVSRERVRQLQKSGLTKLGETDQMKELHAAIVD